MELMHFMGMLAIVFAIFVMISERVDRNKRMKRAAKRIYVGTAL